MLSASMGGGGAGSQPLGKCEVVGGGGGRRGEGGQGRGSCGVGGAPTQEAGQGRCGRSGESCNSSGAIGGVGGVGEDEPEGVGLVKTLGLALRLGQPLPEKRAIAD